MVQVPSISLKDTIHPAVSLKGDIVQMSSISLKSDMVQIPSVSLKGAIYPGAIYPAVSLKDDVVQMLSIFLKGAIYILHSPLRAM